MSSAWIVEPIDILKECGFSFSPRRPCVPPDQFCFQRFEKSLYGCVIVAISLAAHRDLKALLAQALLIIMAAILAAAVGMVNTSWWRLTQIDRHIQCTNSKVFLHPVADRPAD